MKIRGCVIIHIRPDRNCRLRINDKIKVSDIADHGHTPLVRTYAHEPHVQSSWQTYVQSKPIVNTIVARPELKKNGLTPSLKIFSSSESTSGEIFDRSTTKAD
jgi:hypothetical protein